MQEEADDALVQDGAFGKREGFAGETSQALAQGIVKTFNVVGGATAVGGVVLPGREDVMVALQVIGVEGARPVGRRDALPKQPGGGVVARAQSVSDDLTGAAAQGQPQPDHPQPTTPDNAPQLIHFQRVSRFARRQGRFQLRQAQGFFLTRRSPCCAPPQRFDSSLAGYCVPGRRVEWSPVLPPNTHWNRGARDAVVHRPGTGISACHWA